MNSWCFRILECRFEMFRMFIWFPDQYNGIGVPLSKDDRRCIVHKCKQHLKKTLTSATLERNPPPLTVTRWWNCFRCDLRPCRQWTWALIVALHNESDLSCGVGLHWCMSWPSVCRRDLRLRDCRPVASAQHRLPYISAKRTSPETRNCSNKWSERRLT